MQLEKKSAFLQRHPSFEVERRNLLARIFELLQPILQSLKRGTETTFTV